MKVPPGLYKSFFIITAVTAVLVYSTLPAIASAPPDDEVLIAFYDKYNEVRIGLTDHSVFMELDPQTLDLNNRNFQDLHRNELDSFVDSGGEFILGEKIVLQSNVIEYELNDLSDIIFKNGKISFIYLQKKDLVFEDILSVYGNKVLDNFYVEDLERLVLRYREFSAD